MRGSSRKLVVVSNRGPYRSVTSGGKRRWIRSAGGLVAALDPVLRARRGVWVSAEEAEDHSGHEKQPDIEYHLATVEITRADNRGFYQGVSNALLWPLLHSFPPTIRVAEAPWGKYASANRAFADVTLEAATEDDLVWVHDYHLMLVPQMLRDAWARARIGWFCHVPWPSPDLFAILPWRGEILRGLLGADLLGFHTEGYARNFLECVERLSDCTVDYDRGLVRCGRREVRVITAPIGIDVERLDTLARDPWIEDEAARLRHLVHDRRIVLGVDRLDYTKGIPERILAWERFLRDDRAARNKYALVQVMVPSREDVRAYAELKDEVDRLVGDINGRYSSTGQVAIHYLYRNLDQRTLLAHYAAADVALVTPLRDGMNLVAMEYVATRTREDGVLILSELAGVANYLHGALVVNPYDIGAIRDAIAQALEMPLDGMRQRMHRMRDEIRRLDVHRWADGYLRELEREVLDGARVALR